MDWTNFNTPAKKPRMDEVEKKDEPLNLATADCSWIAKPMVKQTSHIEVKPKVKRSKLLGSKSLCQLVPRSLFFKKNDDSCKNTDRGNCEVSYSTKSTESSSRTATNGGMTTSSIMSNSLKSGHLINRIHSDSLLGLHRQSSSNSFCQNKDSRDFTLTQGNLSPIIGDEQDQVLDMSWTNISDANIEHQNMKQTKSPKLHEKNNDTYSNNDTDKKSKNKNKLTSGKYKPFKTTSLVLRDVKNSIGLRLKAKHESQAFAKLTEEIGTPPAKLYSPFDIYTDTSCFKDPKSVEKVVKRKMDFHAGSKQVSGLKTSTSSVEQTSNLDQVPKSSRALLKRKQHLSHENKFAFESPTGRHRTAVKDIERLQQCIEYLANNINSQKGSQ